MSMKGYSQLPVRRGTEILGVFSYRAFASRATEIEGSGVSLDDVPVSEFLESLAIARATDELTSVFDALDADNAVLVGQPDELQAIVTPMDVLRYCIDLPSHSCNWARSSRRCARWPGVVSMTKRFSSALRARWASAFVDEDPQIPRRPEETTFGQLVRIVLDDANWPRFQPGLGGARRELVILRLDPLPGLRNDVFHFRRELTPAERQKLAAERDWLLMQVRMLEAHEAEL